MSTPSNFYTKELKVKGLEKIRVKGGVIISKIVAVRKNEDGDLVAFKLNDGRILNYDEAVRMAKNGEIEHVDVFHRYGREIIRSEPDGIENNNLDNLPQF